ncbi:MULTISPECIES: RNA polymerase sigma factor, RpoD/SigA family [Nostocales]|uniref:RNA polymerase sigma factor n=4 Tax=Nostocales TaxID=1161 RepID=A0A8S9TD21_9CYAN|nr:RNA polymerase sigma factor, RpoD/SigA family [Tolypothrix bouteillei]KAF3889532.1 RNA polymerase sigma factor, RpoD/SigA family [Tolypothrix bouteillei VB521301]
MINSTTSNTAFVSQSKTIYGEDLIRYYLQEIGRVPLLTQEQEISLSTEIQLMMNFLDVKEKLAVKLENEPTLEEWAAEMNLQPKIVLDVLHKGHKAKQKMIQANLRLVVAIAKRYQRRNMELLDLIQEGTLGLERGIEKFDFTKGYKLSTYVYWWIRQGITRAIAQQGRTIRLPVHVVEKLNKMKKVQRELSQTLGRVPTTVEIAKALSLTPSQIRDVMQFSRRPISLELRVGPERDTELQEILEDEAHSPFNYAVEKSLQQDLHSLLSNLSSQQREVICLRFGFTDGHEFSLAEIGQRMGISRERVRQIEMQALNILRGHQDKIRGYLVS